MCAAGATSGGWARTWQVKHAAHVEAAGVARLPASTSGMSTPGDVLSYRWPVCGLSSFVSTSCTWRPMGPMERNVEETSFNSAPSCLKQLRSTHLSWSGHVEGCV